MLANTPAVAAAIATSADDAWIDIDYPTAAAPKSPSAPTTPEPDAVE